MSSISSEQIDEDITEKFVPSPPGQVLTTTVQAESQKNFHHDEELDFEEEDELSTQTSKLEEINNIGEDGELSSESEKDHAKAEEAEPAEKVPAEDLEEGEYVSDGEDSKDSKPNENAQFQQRNDGFARNNFYNNNIKNNRFRQNRTWNSDMARQPRPHLLPPPALAPSTRSTNVGQYVLRPMPRQDDNSWESSLRQAKDLITRATRDREVEEVEKTFDANPPEVRPFKRSASPSPSGYKRRRRSPSVEDEVERRHRLAFDAAPWNDSRGERPREPERRPPRDSNWNRDRSSPPLPSRYDSARNRRRFSPEDARHSSSSHSSYESRRLNSTSTNNGASRYSSERRLPYERPSYEERSRYESKYDERDQSSAMRLDRIPKKYSNVPIESFGSRDRNHSPSSIKSFDSWSESLSDDSSSSYFSDSESKIKKAEKKAKKLSKKKERETLARKRKSPDHSDSDTERNDRRRLVRSPSPSLKHSNTKEPIKMQFMKKAATLQKSSIVRDDFISDDELPDFETAEMMSAAVDKRTQSTSSTKEIIDLDSSGDASVENLKEFLTDEQQRDLEMKLEIVNRKIDEKISKKIN